jgi:ABC-type Fe3+/spermidine/putrescine transport system ATPase subunit
VALARALAARPDLLLLDEPFSAVAESSKRALWFELKKIFRQIKIPVIHVTHNFDEAYTLGAQIGVMIAGRLHQVTTPQTLFERPKTLAVARFLHYRNFFSGPVRELGDGRLALTTERGFEIIFRPPQGPESSCPPASPEITSPATLCIRPQDIKIINPAYPIRRELSDNVYDAVINDITIYPESAVIFVKLKNTQPTNITRHSSNKYDLEMKFPIYILKRYHLHEGKEIRIALWQPGIIVLEE